MKRIIMTAIAAATFAPLAYASQPASAEALMTRSEPATVTVFERDRGINRSGTAAATTGMPSLVDAALILTPRERAIAVDGQVVVHSFGASRSTNPETFSPR